MGNIKAILWDIDGTLLNFEVAETCAIRQCFADFGLGFCTDAMMTEYSQINRKYWQRLERGELTKQQVLEGRFYEFFQHYQLDQSVIGAFNAAYQIALGDTVCFNPHAREVLEVLKGKVGQYAATNGTKVAQSRKLAKSGLDQIFDAVFISEDIGAEKPAVEFFHAVWRKIGAVKPEEVLIVGDSLTSDIQGGNNAGLRCCWYNPHHAVNTRNLRIDYEIDDLEQVLTLL